MIKDIRQVVGDNLKTLRKLHNYSQQRLSDELHISRSTYNQFENGHQLPNIDTLLTLSQMYSITIDNILYFSLPNMIQTMRITDNYRLEKDGLLEIFNKLTPVSKGALLERATFLLELDEKTAYQKRMDALFIARERGDF